MKTLYISYFGATKHLVQTQVLTYLRELAKSGVEVTLVTFEEALPDPVEERRQIAALETSLAAANIDWHHLRYHKRPSLPATTYDVLVGIAYSAYLIQTKRIEVVHARSHIPAVMALALKALLGTKLLFDVRGLMAEEYVDNGVWKVGSLPYRITKWVEATAFRRADAIVMLTHKIKGILSASSPELKANPVPIEVIPCCVDLSVYPKTLDGSAARTALGLDGKTVMVYGGTLGGWALGREMVDLFALARKSIPNLHFLVLTQSDPAQVRQPLDEHGIPASDYTITTVPAAEMPRVLGAAHFALFFHRPCYSKLASSPTKVGEYLAAGLPVLTNTGIGDIDELVTDEKVGVLVDGLTPAAYAEALPKMVALIAEGAVARRRCQEVAERYYSLENVGRERYLRVYRRLEG